MPWRIENRSKTAQSDFESLSSDSFLRSLAEDKGSVSDVSQFGEDQRRQMEAPEMALLETPWRKLEKDPWTQEVRENDAKIIKNIVN